MNPILYDMLYSEAVSEKKKALLTLHLLGDKAAGIGDHSTKDFYNNATEALEMLGNAKDKIETLKSEFGGIHEKLIKG
jgi:hypothetical protein